MKIKTSELQRPALDWAVATCVGGTIKTEHGVFLNQGDGYDYFTPSIDWAQGGPIVERNWEAICRWALVLQLKGEDDTNCGGTLLRFWMRCYVASKLGDEVEVPEELV